MGLVGVVAAAIPARDDPAEIARLEVGVDKAIAELDETVVELNSYTDVGGYLVPEEFRQRIVEAAREPEILREK